MVSNRKTLRQVTALCALAVFALSGCEQFQKEKRDDRSDDKVEQNDGPRDDRWTRRTMPGDKKENGNDKADDWGQPTAEQMDDSEDRWGRQRPAGNGSRSSSDGWNETHRPQRDEKTAPYDDSRRWGQRRPNGNGSRSSSDGWNETRRPQNEVKTAPNDSSSRWGQRKPNDNGSRSSSEGWRETRRPQVEERTSPNDSSSRWGERRPADNGSRSSSDGWRETRRPQRDEKSTPDDSSRRWGQQPPSDNGSRSSSDGWRETRRPQRDDDKAAPNDSSSRWGERRPSRNGSRSSSDGWYETYRPDRAPSDGRAAVRQRVRENIVELATGDRNLSTLVDAIRKADLSDTLAGRGPFTLFAPSNAAFDKMPSGKLQDLLKPENRHQLREFLTYHVVSGKLSNEQLSRMRTLRSLQGQTLTITVKNGKVYVDDAEVEGADMSGTNGVIHVINKVLTPE
jgi:uncharacterized surface protein with fasciclin (FAS1) repeats